MEPVRRDLSRLYHILFDDSDENVNVKLQRVLDEYPWMENTKLFNGIKRKITSTHIASHSIEDVTFQMLFRKVGKEISMEEFLSYFNEIPYKNLIEISKSTMLTGNKDLKIFIYDEIFKEVTVDNISDILENLLPSAAYRFIYLAIVNDRESIYKLFLVSYSILPYKVVRSTIKGLAKTDDKKWIPMLFDYVGSQGMSGLTERILKMIILNDPPALTAEDLPGIMKLIDYILELRNISIKKFFDDFVDVVATKSVYSTVIPAELFIQAMYLLGVDYGYIAEYAKTHPYPVLLKWLSYDEV